jgi:2-keto-3-deoxy-L-rhamnonate aldolase RhmA
MAQIEPRRRFHELRAQGIAPLGMFVNSTDPATTAIAAAAGYDFVVIDREHGPADLSHASSHILAARAGGTIPLIRILEDSPRLIQQALDLGAAGVIVPKVATAQQAARAVCASRYQPGGRGMCPGVAATTWSYNSWDDYSDQSNRSVVVIPLIETRAGIANARQIAEVDGIDYLLFGLGDLTQELGLDLSRGLDQLELVWNEFADSVHAGGAWAGSTHGYGFTGYDFGTYGMDLMLLRTMLEHGVGVFRKLEQRRD